jgi:uncharacterized cupredoxin-like copper-binding protein
MNAIGTRTRRRLAAAAFGAAFLLAGCGEAQDAGDGATTPAPQDGPREIEIVAADDLRFTPASVTGTAGETVTFVVRNEGQMPHDFVLGNEREQDEHESGGGHAGHDDSAMTVEPGATERLTWTFAAERGLLFACHQPGHYEAGMVGAIEITS